MATAYHARYSSLSISAAAKPCVTHFESTPSMPAPNRRNHPDQESAARESCQELRKDQSARSSCTLESKQQVLETRMPCRVVARYCHQLTPQHRYSLPIEEIAICGSAQTFTPPPTRPCKPRSFEFRCPVRLGEKLHGKLIGQSTTSISSYKPFQCQARRHT